MMWQPAGEHSKLVHCTLYTLYYVLCTMHCSMKKNRNKTDEINKKLSLLGERLIGLQAEVCDGETVLSVMVRLC